MFCQLLYLRRCIPARIRRALEELPKTLDETYARSLEEIEEQNWEYARRLFQCVAAASRPLHVSELAEFLAFDFDAGSTPTFLSDWRPEDPAHTVLSVCSSLLAVVRQDGGSPVVQFAHFSVKEYLVSTRLAEAKDTISHFHVSMIAAHSIVAQACLGVLLHLDKTVTKDSLEDYPLVEYAAEHWVDHARFENVSSIVEDGMKRLFDPSRSHLSVWTWIYDPENTDTRRDEFSEPPEEARASSLHYAALCGMHDIVKFLIVEHSQNVNARGYDKKETPLHSALRHGHADVALLLLKHGGDANAQDYEKRTPLLLASEGGHVDVVRVLLKQGVNIEGRDGEDWSPLERSSYGGHVEVVRVLLEHGADAKARDGRKFTPLHLALGAEVARLLLKHGADPNALKYDGQTPLHWLSGIGRERVASALALLEHGVDIHVRDDQGHTPFMSAKNAGNHDMMQLLLEYGAEDHREQL